MKIIGLSDTFTTCDCCGRKKLKKTIVLDDNGAILYYGTSCAAMAIYGYKESSVNTKVRNQATDAQFIAERRKRDQVNWVNDAKEALSRFNQGKKWQTDPLLKRFNMVYRQRYDVFNIKPGHVSWKAWLEAQAAGA